jgi:CTP:molybdopterin cytidylyltransferase MocA
MDLLLGFAGLYITYRCFSLWWNQVCERGTTRVLLDKLIFRSEDPAVVTAAFRLKREIDCAAELMVLAHLTQEKVRYGCSRSLKECVERLTSELEQLQMRLGAEHPAVTQATGTVSRCQKRLREASCEIDSCRQKRGNSEAF